MKTQVLFFGRIVLAWTATFIIAMMFTSAIGLDRIQEFIAFIFWLSLILLMIAAASHLQRVERLVGAVDAEKLKNRHTRQIEIPFETAIALPMVEDSLRVLPISENIKVSNEGMRFRVRVKPVDLDNNPPSLWKKMTNGLGIDRSNHVIAEASVGDGAVSVKLVCEPEGAAWLDYLFPDEGTNLQNAETVTRAISQRIAEFRRGEQASNTETVVEKELAVAKLSLLHAQVEPHFLYNTLGSAKYLIAGDPGKAEAMLDNLILYLRHSLPRDADAPSTLGEEITRTRAYLDILKIRMDERLQVSIELPAELGGVPFPSMMLQTLAENAINHGLEPKTGGGRIWITARKDIDGDSITVTVADDGIGFGGDTSGTGIGLKNIRERLKLAYGSAANFTIIANFPEGVAASINVPLAGPAA
ncbi:MAG: histidine kinase [Arenimonas sp.]|nr:histidine kinase [Arenimonas sp.]MBP7981864.1 histidine kinase [Arenimonas sp.]